MTTVVVIPVIRAGLLLVGFQRLRRLLAGLSPPGSAASGPSGAERAARARQISRIVDIGSRRGPAEGSCLHRSLALWWLLRRRQIDSELRIGAQLDENELSAHAWVELDGEVLNDTPDVAARFRPFEGLSV